MTEPENFEDDLFADLYDCHQLQPRPGLKLKLKPKSSLLASHGLTYLRLRYDDNDASKAPSAPVAAPVVEPSKTDDQVTTSTLNDHTQQDQTMHQDGGDDDPDDDDDDDDEVDFNLGGGGGGSGSRDDHNAAAASSHDVEASTPPYGTVHKASAKDDG